METKKLKEALAEIRKEEPRKFEQSIDLIINLKGIDPKREGVNLVLSVPHKIKDKKVCGFFVEKSPLVSTIREPDFAKYKDKKLLKNLVKNFDYFIANAKLMPQVATVFGKVLGPVGKMPSPQLGILPQENEVAIKAILHKIDNSLKIRLKESSIKVIAGKEKMNDEQIIENVRAIYTAIINALPKKIDNLKNVMIKTTMGAPIKVDMQ